MTLAGALAAASADPTPATMRALFDALVAAPDEEYFEFWAQLDRAPIPADLRRNIEQAEADTAQARSIVKSRRALDSRRPSQLRSQLN